MADDVQMSAAPAKAGGGGLFSGQVSAKSARVKLAEMVIFTRQLATMLTAGVPLVQALEIISEGQGNPTARELMRDIKTEIEDTLRTTFGSQINLLPESVFGQLIGVFSERESLLWEAMEDVYNSQYPDTSFGVSLDNVAALSSIVRQGAQASTVTGYRLFGTASTLVPSGTQFSVSGSPDSKFTSDSDVTLVAGTDAQQTISFDAVPDAGTWRLNWRGNDTTDLAYNDNAAAVQAALNALPFGTGITVSGNYTTGFTVDFAGAAGKQVQPLIVEDDNTLTSGGPAVVITIAEAVAGVNQGTVGLTATTTGAIVAPAGTLTVIDTPVAGLTSGINVDDATVGRDIESDADLRARRAETLQVAGAGTPEAIRSRLLNLEGVTDVIIFENQTEVTDGDGRPPKSFEAVVGGGDQQEIIDLLWQVKPAGILTVGSISGTAVDSQGVSQTINFSRPTDVDIWLEVDLTVDNALFPANGITSAEQALVDRGNEFGIGQDVIVVPSLVCSLDDIAGILGVVVRIGTAASPTASVNISIDPNEISRFSTARTQVQVV